MKQSQDVDEWLLGGLSDEKKAQIKHHLMTNMDEDSIIQKKLEENQLKQASSQIEKTVIIDDL